ncbi:coiled-coil domain-containing protein 28A isoform X6 [Thunnus albacares]|uniref:coiled-coil domain-containing protein 28A isoform X6 n=1 Tax=Thunnus albacares TaxID=8236 RepID=UPI001CF6DCAE|nr:coiled-coil domain-containing protein 28A isoform X6 [Thunnus albacares]
MEEKRGDGAFSDDVRHQCGGGGGEMVLKVLKQDYGPAEEKKKKKKDTAESQRGASRWMEKHVYRHRETDRNICVCVSSLDSPLPIHLSIKDLLLSNPSHHPSSDPSSQLLSDRPSGEKLITGVPVRTPRRPCARLPKTSASPGPPRGKGQPNVTWTLYRVLTGQHRNMKLWRSES